MHSSFLKRTGHVLVATESGEIVKEDWLLKNMEVWQYMQDKDDKTCLRPQRVDDHVTALELLSL